MFDINNKIIGIILIILTGGEIAILLGKSTGNAEYVIIVVFLTSVAVNLWIIKKSTKVTIKAGSSSEINIGNSEFLCIQSDDEDVVIIVDKQTKVMYLCYSEICNGGMTMLVNEDGTPKLFSGAFDL